MLSQAWVVILYYVLLLVLTLFFRYIVKIRWWSSFILSLTLTYVVIIFTGPDWGNEHGTVDMIFLVLLLILAIFAPILIFIYVAVQAFDDLVSKQCTVDSGYFNLLS